MTSIQKTVKCSDCGNESSISINSDLEVKEITFAGKCRCGCTVQVTYSVVGAAIPPGQPPSEPTFPDNPFSSSNSSEVPSDVIKDLIEE